MHEALSPAEERFERLRKRAGLILAPLASIVVWLIIWFAELPLNGPAHQLAAVFAFIIVLWMTEAIPMPVTGLLAPVLIVLTGIAPAEKAFAAFGDKVIYLFLGSFLLAGAMKKHGLDRRIATGLLSLPAVSRSPARLLAGLGLLTAGLSMWMSNTAITAIMLPIVTGIIAAQPGLASQRHLCAGLVLMVAFSASIGGLATPVGTPTNLVALSQLRAFGITPPSFFEWMRLGVPLALILIVVLFLTLRPTRNARFDAVAGELTRLRAALPPFSTGERNTLFVFALAIALWLLPGFAELFAGEKWHGSQWMKTRLPEELIGIGAGLLLFLLPTGGGKFTLEWEDTRHVEWGALFLFAGGIALGKQVGETGLAKAIGDGAAALLHQPSEGLIIALAIIVCIALSEATSNVASANVMVPIMISVAQSAGADPRRVAIAACLACSLGFMLPISTPPNALAYGTGHIRLPFMMRHGLILDIAGGIAVWCCVRWLL